jgi:uncharacterized protein
VHQIPGLYISHDKARGRGVFTSGFIHIGDLIEVCPVLIIPKQQLPIVHKTIIHDYYFLWGTEMEDCAIALGFGSLYNHDVHPNADFILDMEHETIDIVAIRDIEAGSEIMINYHGEPGNEDPLWF